MNSPLLRALRNPVLLSVLALIALLGCESGGPPTSDKDLQHLEYRQVVAELDSATEKRPVLLVDVRSPDAFAKGHLPNAVNMPLADLNPRDARFDKATRVIVYHEDFKGAYADVAAKKLISGGVVNVYSYAGGYKDWMTRQAEGGVPVPPSDDAKDKK